MNYEVKKVFNNNVVLAIQNKREVILISRGIGFGQKDGNPIEVDSETIEKVFHEGDKEDFFSYLEMIPKYNKEVVGVSEEIISEGKKTLGSLSSNIHIALVEHITYALDRIHVGLPIENPFTEEIMLFYQREYEVAELAARLIKERLGIDIGDGETGFIALHLYSAYNNKTIRETMKDTRLFKSCIDMIDKEIKGRIDNRDYVYKGFISDMKLILSTCRKEKTIENPLIKEIQYKMQESYCIAKKIGTLVEKEKVITLPEGMMAYIAVDIEKIRQFCL